MQQKSHCITPLQAARSQCIFRSACLGLLLLSLFFGTRALAQPNFVLILSDDHGAADSGAYGNNRIQTPNLDKLARQGIRFDAAFATAAICTPSRSSLYTGLYPMRHGAHRNHTEVFEGTLSLPHYFEPMGYQVHLAGKTHIGPSDAFPFSKVSASGSLFSAKTIDNYLPAMEDVFNSGQPFLLVVATSLPHTLIVGEPYPESDRYNADDIELPPYLVNTKETRQNRAGYYELVTQLDSEVGKVVTALDTSAAADNTVVIYASDHGAGFAFEKWTNYDAGIRVPLIVRLPQQTLAGHNSEALVSLVDVLPTMLALANADAPANIDGRSFAAVLKDPSRKHRDYVFATHTTLGIRNAKDAMPIRAIRNARFKYIRNLNPEGTLSNNVTEQTQSAWPSWVQAAMNGDTFAASRINAYQHRPAEELYSLEADPFELNNVINNPGYRSMLPNLRATLDIEMSRQNDEGLAAPYTDSNLGFVVNTLLEINVAWMKFKKMLTF